MGVVEHRNGNGAELAVIMAGRASKWPIANFEGTWTPIELEDTP